MRTEVVPPHEGEGLTPEVQVMLISIWRALPGRMLPEDGGDRCWAGYTARQLVRKLVLQPSMRVRSVVMSAV